VTSSSDSSPVVLVADERADRFVEALRPDMPQFTWRTATDRDALVAGIPEAEVLMTLGMYIDADMIALAPRLRWIQGLASGTDHLLRALTRRPDVRLSSMRGFHSRPVAEHALMLMLAVSRRFPILLDAQRNHEWMVQIPDLLAGRTVAIAGMGTIGSAIASRCRAFEMKTIGFGTQARDEASVDSFATYAEMPERLGDVDFLVFVTPPPPATQGMFNHAIFDAMKPGSTVINVGRGATLVTADLVAAMLRGHISGAALDVLEEEPLPSTSPLWDVPNLIITPHHAGNHSGYVDATLGLIRKNLSAFASGRFDDMENLVR
jgi:D-2-hydroxyacid dehydrogenase (NADP+)